ncbi:hypothetical protein NX722_14495 [Endozoicomonas gorgoniicola]|uniref:Uncharacterized protein n=1 Tax=Endozoicomonas gorgoniicola TaxID=1234144 RepID=A0ABT3MXW0_9GAMM|nr:hypothetical protein [Endozoicomonas gorgoniicola]MCW7553814.1 hypothetical protein [Endozoicomonas gorgoniicola]
MVTQSAYKAVFSLPDDLFQFVYAVYGERALPETQDEAAVEEAPVEGTLGEVTDENPVEPTTSNFGNTPDTLPELNPSLWERLTHPFINLLFQQNSR